MSKCPTGRMRDKQLSACHVPADCCSNCCVDDEAAQMLTDVKNQMSKMTHSNIQSFEFTCMPTTEINLRFSV